MAPDSSNFSRRANDLVMGLGRHWLLLFNSVWEVYLIIPFLAPLLMQMGWEPAARAVYSLYAFLCHQLPERSYFLFGPTLVPTEAELVATQRALEAGDRSADREILKRLRQSDAPDAKALIADVEALYALLDDSEADNT